MAMVMATVWIKKPVGSESKTGCSVRNNKLLWFNVE